MASMAVPAARAAAAPTHTPAERSSFLIAHGLAKYNFRGEDDENDDDGYGSKEHFNSDVQRAWGPEAIRAVGRLRQHLMVYLNDDILAGSLFAPTEDHAYATSATPDGGPGFIVRLRASANEAGAAPAAQQDVVFPCTTQQAADLYKLARPAPLGVEGRGDVVDLSMRKARELPASDLELPPFLRGANLPAAFPHVVESIHKRLAATTDGIVFEDYKINVYESGDYFIAHRDALTSEDVWGTLVVHLPCIGDYTDPVYSERSPDRFSYWSDTEEQWPCVPGVRDMTRLDDSLEPHAAMYPAERGELDFSHFKCGGPPDAPEQLEAAQQQQQQQHAERRADGGALRFFIGRGVHPRATSTLGAHTDVECYERGLRNCEPSNRASAMYCASVLMQNYTEAEVARGELDETTVNSFANVLAMPRRRQQLDPSIIKSAVYGVDFDVQIRDDDSEEAQKQKREKIAQVLAARAAHKPTCANDDYDGPTTLTTPFRRLAALQPGTRRAALPLHFAAFHASVLHDVRPLRSGHRITMTYKIRRASSKPVPLPTGVWAFPDLHRIVDDVVDALLRSPMNQQAIAARNELADEGDAAALAIERVYGRDAPAVGLGICLRHAYPAGQISSGRCLRGVDLVVAKVLSERFESAVFPATIIRSEYSGRVFCVDHQLRRDVVLTADTLTVMGLRDYWFDPECARRYPMVTERVAFLDIGFGMLVGGGAITGNRDCHIDFYHRSAVLISTLKPTRWRRRRVLFLIALRGDPAAHPLVASLRRISRMYAPWRNIAYFL